MRRGRRHACGRQQTQLFRRYTLISSEPPLFSNGELLDKQLGVTAQCWWSEEVCVGGAWCFGPSFLAGGTKACLFVREEREGQCEDMHMPPAFEAAESGCTLLFRDSTQDRYKRSYFDHDLVVGGVGLEHMLAALVTTQDAVRD